MATALSVSHTSERDSHSLHTDGRLWSDAAEAASTTRGNTGRGQCLPTGLGQSIGHHSSHCRPALSQHCQTHTLITLAASASELR